MGGFDLPLTDDLGSLRIIADPSTELMCFRLLPRFYTYHLPWPHPFPMQTLTLANEFGERTATVTNPDEFCTPATRLY